MSLERQSDRVRSGFCLKDYGKWLGQASPTERSLNLRKESRAAYACA